MLTIVLQKTENLHGGIILKSKINPNKSKIRRPLLARGTKAAGLGLIAFLTISGHAFQLSGYAFMSLEGSGRW